MIKGVEIIMLKASALVKTLFYVYESYVDINLVVLDENHQPLINEKLNTILYKTYQFLKSYQVLSWKPDGFNNTIKNITLIVRKVSA